MSISRRLAAHRQAVASAEPVAALPETDPTRPNQDEEDETTTDSKKEKDKNMTTITKEEHEAALATARAEAKAEGAKENQARNDAVLASEHFKGREAAAARLLKKEALSADDIIATLADLPAHNAAAPANIDQEAVEAAARAQMQQNIDKNANSGVQAGGGVAPETDKPDDSLVQSMKARFPNAK